MVRRELRIDSRNRGLAGVAGELEALQILPEAVEAGEEVRQMLLPFEVVVGLAIEAAVGVGERLTEVKEVAGERLIEVREGVEAHLTEVKVEVEKWARCLLLEVGVQDVKRLAVMEVHVKLVLRAFSVAMEGGDFHLLAEQNEYGMMLFLLREAEVEQLLDWVLEVVLHFVVPEKEEELRTSSRFLLARTHHQWESLGVWVEEVALGWKELEHDFGQVLKYST